MLKLMRAGDSRMLDADYRIEGSVGTLSMPIRERGTGEVIFSLGGVRRGAGARSEDGKPVEKGAEVVIERYEKGIAYVKRWEEFTKLTRTRDKRTTEKFLGLTHYTNSPDEWKREVYMFGLPTDLGRSRAAGSRGSS